MVTIYWDCHQTNGISFVTLLHRSEVIDHSGYKTLSGIHVHTEDRAGQMLEIVLMLGDTHSLYCQYLNSSMLQEYHMFERKSDG